MSSRYDFVHLTEVGSTQDEAVARFDRSDDDVLVIADRQVDGRGRQGRTWEQPDRALFSSFAYDSGWDPERRGLIPLVVGVSVAEAIEELFDASIRLKWPNDVLVTTVNGHVKVGGILVEASGDRVTVGCGVNLWWENPIEGAGCVADSDLGPTAGPNLAREWVDRFLEHLTGGSDAWPRDRYVERSATIGSQVSWDEGEGTAADIGADGSLIVATTEGTTAIHAGDVHLRG